MPNTPDESRAAEIPSSPVALGEAKGDVIGRYTLVEELGEGGMGTVWLAQQSEPVVRTVALKIIKAGMDTREVIARFETERQALALMDHPWIAKVLDGGPTASGRPYFVMEHVRGVPINEHCDAAEMDTGARLELFVKVCEAIQHAHQRGLIHRDIKPSNVLVAETDGEFAPKVIDFGIAKATSGDLSEGTLLTQHAQILGTPEYMSPEQAALSGQDIDTRADVYSLGMLLYELLTSRKPFDLQSVIASGYDELLRTICEVDPPRPSTRVTTDGTPREIAAMRKVDLDTLVKGLSGDLDWIVMKAVEKDRSRRYASASELASDIVRYIEHEPVMAAPPSKLYRMRKLVQRRKKTVLAVGVALLLFVAGSIGTGLGLWKAVRANAALDVSLVEEQRQRGLAEQNERLAREAEGTAAAEALRATRAEADTRERALELEQVADFQSDQLRSVDPQGMGAGLRAGLLEQVPEEDRATFSELLSSVNFTTLALNSLEQTLFGDTLKTIEERFGDQPLVRARLLQTMARSLRGLGLIETAAEPQERALAALRELLGDEHPETLRSISSAAILRDALGDPTASEALLREALTARRRTLGDEDEETLESMGSLGAMLWILGRRDEAEPLYREALEVARRVYGADHENTLSAQRDVAGMLRDQARYEEASALYEDLLERTRRTLGPDDWTTLGVMTAAASLYRRSGDPDRGEPLAREALATHLRIRGEEHPQTLAAMEVLAAVLSEQGNHEESLQLSSDALEINRRTLGEEHPKYLTSLSNLGVTLLALGRGDEAGPRLREVEAMRRRILPEANSSRLASTSNLGIFLLQEGEHTEAEPFLHEASVGRRRALGAEHPRTLSTTGQLRKALAAQIDGARAAGDEQQQLGERLAHSGAFELECGEPAAALPLLSEASDLLAALLPNSDARLRHLESDLGATLAALDQREEAEPLLLRSAEWMLENAAPSAALEGQHEHPAPQTAADLVRRTVEFYEAWEQESPGEGHAERTLDLRTRMDGWDS